jgi:uncharacterized protein
MSQPRHAPASSEIGDRLLANLLQFGRLLRYLGLPPSASQMSELAASLEFIDITQRDDFFHTCRSFLVRSPEQFDIFEQAFDLFWAGQQQWIAEFGAARHSQPTLESEARLLPKEDNDQGHFVPDNEADEPPETPEANLQATFSACETLRQRDFASFTDEELEVARRYIDTLVWRLETRRTRRKSRAHKRTAYFDSSRTIRQSMRQQGEIVQLYWLQRKHKPRPLVVICDISGSMERYSRVFLHLMYALHQHWHQVEAFVFGTRLTSISGALQHKDVDTVVGKLSETVFDWSGGTRIGESLRTFNYRYGRRVLRRGAVVLILSDGWDRGDTELLQREIDRLHRSSHRLIWLNPLLGSPDYKPLVKGIQTILPHVDDFLPLHNLASLEELGSRHLGQLVV